MSKQHATMRGLFSATAFLALGACATDPRPAPSPTALAADPTRYACNDGSFLSVRFVAGGADVTMLDGSTTRLGERPAASGFAYASDRLELRGQGDAATWIARGSPPTSCIAT